MRVGVVFPQTEIGSDPAAIRDFAQAAEGMGYHHLLAYDHIVGANPASYPNTKLIYTHESAFHELFVLFGYLAGQTERIELFSGILILPQRQTVLVAKQAAEVDVLSGGRLRLGVAVGWNPVEFEAQNEDFSNRGQRIEEQIEVMRALWTQDLVNYQGKWHRITDAGVNPRPVQQSIPIWFGGGAPAVIRRVGQIGDGWIPFLPTDATGEAMIEEMHGHARDAGRDPADIKIECMIQMREGAPDDWAKKISTYRDMGVSYISGVTMNADCKTPADHIKAIERFKDAAGDFFDT
jgi:probable F420-dependent oxidoreductase